MSFERLKRSWGAVGIRLTAGYVALLLLTVLLLFGLSDLQMGRALLSRDHAAILTELSELAADFEDEGLVSLEEEAEERNSTTDARPLYLRLVSNTGKTQWSSDWPEGSLQRLDAIPGQLPDWSTVRSDDGDLLEVASRKLSDNLRLDAAASTRQRNETLTAFRETFLLAALPVLVFGLLGGLLLARHVLRPLKDLAAFTRHVADTAIVTERIPVRGSNDELDALTTDFNKMLGRVDQLVSGIRDTLDNVAHDLRTPMTTLRGRIELALRKPDSDRASYQQALEDSLDASGQVLEILNAIMDESEAETGTLPLHKQQTSLLSVAENVGDLYQYIAEDRSIDLKICGDASVITLADPARLKQAIANLVDNALKYTEAGGKVEIEVLSSGTEAQVHVRDTGVGITEDDLPRIWDRLYRGDSSRSSRGLGLGLSLAKAIVEAHGGRLAVESKPMRGSDFVVSLPLAIRA